MGILTAIYLIVEILRHLSNYSIGILKVIAHKNASITTSVILTATE